MNENERDFKKVLESIKSLESQIIELNLYVREQIKHLLENNKKDITYQHEVNLDDKKVIGQIINLISVQTNQIKEEAENFIYKCLVDNESKKDPKEKLTRLDICDILHTDFEIPKSTAYRYYKDSFNLYKWEQAKPDPDKKIKDNKDTILDNVLDTAEAALADGDNLAYYKGIELYSKLLTRFKKV